MTTGLEKIYDEALSLPSDARLHLIERLLASLNLPMQPEIDRLWADEAERRVSQIDEGMELISGEEVFIKIRNKYQ